MLCVLLLRGVQKCSLCLLLFPFCIVPIRATQDITLMFSCYFVFETGYHVSQVGIELII